MDSIDKKFPDDDDDDFIPINKKPKIKPDDLKAMFKHSSLQNCTFNIQFKQHSYFALFCDLDTYTYTMMLKQYEKCALTT